MDYRPDPHYRGTPRQTAGSYFNAIFTIAMYGCLSRYAWKSDFGAVSKGFVIVFGFMCLLQVFGLVLESMGVNDQMNPVTGEWTTVPTGGDPTKLRKIRDD